jgi:hypothetical protein
VLFLVKSAVCRGAALIAIGGVSAPEHVSRYLVLFSTGAVAMQIVNPSGTRGVCPKNHRANRIWQSCRVNRVILGSVQLA